MNWLHQWLVVVSLTWVVASQVTVTHYPQFCRQNDAHVYYFEGTANVVTVDDGHLQVSVNNGKSFTPVAESSPRIISFQQHQFVESRAFAFDDDFGLWYTFDDGAHWTRTELLNPTNFTANDDDRRLELDIELDQFLPVPYDELSDYANHQFMVEDLELMYNAANPELLLAQLPVHVGHGRGFVIYVYSDSGGQHWSRLGTDPVTSCAFLRASEHFSGGTERTVVCSDNNRLWRSDDWFQSRQRIDLPPINKGHVAKVYVVSRYLVVTLEHEPYCSGLMVSTSGDQFSRLDFVLGFAELYIHFDWSTPQRLRLGSPQLSFTLPHLYKVFEVDSSGQHIRQVGTNVAYLRAVEAPPIDGVRFTNIANDEDNQHLIRTFRTADDGRTWHRLAISPRSVDSDQCRDQASCFLNVIPTLNGGSSSASVSGIMMAVGVVGDVLETQGPVPIHHRTTTWISRDGGRLWTQALNESCAIGFGNFGNVIVALPRMSRDYYYYSLNQGHSWHQHHYPHNITVEAFTVKITSDGLVPTFTSMTSNGTFTFDFGQLFSGKICGDDDREHVYSTPPCFQGFKQTFKRRKPLAQCLIKHNSTETVAHQEPCPCSEADFQCAPGFAVAALDFSNTRCVPDPQQVKQMCHGDNKKVLHIPDKLQAAGSQCHFFDKDPSDFVSMKDIDCSRYLGTTSANGIGQFTHHMPADIKKYVFVRAVNDTSNRISAGKNLFVQLHNNDIYVSKDGGDTFTQLVTDDVIVGIHGIAAEEAVVLVGLKNLYHSTNGGDTFERRDMPSAPVNGVARIELDENNRARLLWFGCNPDTACTTYDVWSSDDAAMSFTPLLDNVRHCQLESGDGFACTVPNNHGTFDLVRSRKSWQTSVDDAVSFSCLSGMLLVAQADKHRGGITYKVIDTWLSRYSYESPSFPWDHRGRVGTVVSSANQGFVLFHPIDDDQGVLVKFDIAAPVFTTIVTNVSHDGASNVDVGRIGPMEGTWLVNQVVATHPKRVRTMISYDDGNHWVPLSSPPATDACSGECHLNLDDITTRGVENFYSSLSPNGVIMGCGNVGAYLDKTDPNYGTFMSADGGVSWRQVARGCVHWEVGDGGSVVVLVDKQQPTQELRYSLDYGDTWTRYRFSDTSVVVTNVTSGNGPDTSLRFILFANHTHTHGMTIITINLTGLFRRQCDYGDMSTDFDMWTPPYPNGSCLYDHRLSFPRKSNPRQCFIGTIFLHSKKQPCLCTVDDYECDDNYVRDPTDHQCKLRPGVSVKDIVNERCADGESNYYKPTGYRRKATSHCDGIQPYSATKEACPVILSSHIHISRKVILVFTVAVIVNVIVALVIGIYLSCCHLQQRQIDHEHTIREGADGEDEMILRSKTLFRRMWVTIGHWFKGSSIVIPQDIELTDDLPRGDVCRGNEFDIDGDDGSDVTHSLLPQRRV